MSGWSTLVDDALVEFMFRGGSLTPPATYYVGLYTSAVGKDGSGTEVSGGSYARQAMPADAATWTAAGGTGYTTNKIAITFPVPTASWGLIQYAALLDAASGGNVWASGILSPPHTVNLGDPAPHFLVGNFLFKVNVN